MKNGKHTALEKCGIAVLGLTLWVITAALVCAIVFDLWIIKPAALRSTPAGRVTSQQWMIGLWKSCLISEHDPSKITS